MFTEALLDFLTELKNNNNKEWFTGNKECYERQVRTPALNFINAFQSELHKISPHFLAIAKKTGGSLMRPYRDTRFSKDKTPYKTNLGIQFRHQMGKDVHAPGFYFHISPDDVFIGSGMWHPEPSALKNIRTLIDEAPSAWKKIRHNKVMLKDFEFVGESLVNPPRGFSKDHPDIEDLKRKDFIVVASLSKDQLFDKNIVKEIAKQYKKTEPLMKFLCEAQQLNF